MIVPNKGKNEASSPLINEKIRAERMQVISSNGENLGTLTREEALSAARAARLDLVLIAERNSDGIPVVKIMDHGKAIYAKKKQQADAKKNQKVIQIKEVKLRPKIGEHDFQTKMNQTIGFLEDGKRVKITLVFKGREITMREERGSELFVKIDKAFEVANLTKRLTQEKDLKTPQFWSRVYFIK